MGRVFTIVACLAGLSAPLAAAHEPGAGQLLVDVWLGPQGHASASVTLEAAPPNAEALRRAIGASVGDDDPVVSTEVYELGDAGSYEVSAERSQWAVYAGEDWSPRAFQWVYEMTVDPRALADAIEDSGFDSAHVHVSGERYPGTRTPPGLETEWDDGQWFTVSATYAAGEDAVSLEFAQGYPRRWVLTRAGFLACLLAFPTIGAWWLRRSALARRDAEPGQLCFPTIRRFGWIVGAYWVGWIVATYTFDLDRMYAFYRGYGEGWPGWWPVQPEILLAFAAVLPAKPMLYPVLKRFPGATWQRKDFFWQGFWLNGLIVLVAVALDGLMGLALYNAFAESLLQVVVALVLIVIGYLQYLGSLGFVLQTVEEGELRNRVDELAHRAGLDRIRDLYVVYFTKAPLPNAFAANGLRLMVTDYLLHALSKEEVDAILAHELGHLRANHPRKLLAATVAAVFVAVVLTVLVHSGGLFALARFGLTEQTILAAFAVGLPAGLLARYAVSRRYERQADAAAVELTGDAEAFIRGLAKITRLHYMPLRLGRWRERLSTHPSTRRRIESAAARAGLAPERVDGLLAHPGASGDHYTLPESAQFNRIFSSRFKTRVALMIGVSSLAIPVGVPWGVVKFASMWEAALAAWLPNAWALGAVVTVAAGVLGAVCLFMFQDRAALSGFRGMRRALASRLGIGGEHGWWFVGFSPKDGAYVYEGFTNWDVGFLRMEDDRLVYRGDGTNFELPRSAVESVDMPARREGRWTPSRRARVRWRQDADGETRSFLFEAADAGSLRAANRKTEAMHDDLRAWKDAGEDAASPVDAKLPPEFEVRAQPLAGVLSVPRIVVSVLVVALLGYLFGLTIEPVTSVTAVAWSVCAGLGAGLAAGVVSLPQFRVEPSPDEFRRPVPGQDPFEREKT